MHRSWANLIGHRLLFRSDLAPILWYKYWPRTPLHPFIVPVVSLINGAVSKGERRRLSAAIDAYLHRRIEEEREIERHRDRDDLLLC